MTLQTVPPIRLNQIKQEFGVSGTYGLTSFYRGGGIVPNIPANNNVPTSGPISLLDFLGATNTPPASFSVTANNVFFIAPLGDTTASGTSTAVPSAAPGAVSYSWALLSGTPMLVSGGSSATATFSTTQVGGREASYRVTATSVGQTATRDITVYLQIGDPE